MSHQPFVIERSFRAPVARVWEALTNKDQMKQWYFDLETFEAVPGFEFRFSGKGAKGEQYVHHCQVKEVIPLKKLSYSWTYENYEGYSVVTFELSEEDGGTKLVLTHDGLESFPALPDFALESFSAGWTYLMGTALKAFVEK